MSFCNVDTNTWGGLYIGGLATNDIQNSSIIGNTGSGFEISEWKFSNDFLATASNEGIPTLSVTSNNVYGNAATTFELSSAIVSVISPISGWGSCASEISPTVNSSPTFEIPLGYISAQGFNMSRYCYGTCTCDNPTFTLRNAYNNAGVAAATRIDVNTNCSCGSTTLSYKDAAGTFSPTDQYYWQYSEPTGSNVHVLTSPVTKISLGGFEVYSTVGNAATFNFTNNYWGTITGVNTLVKDVNNTNTNYAGYAVTNFANAHSNIPDGSPVVNLGADGPICQGTSVTLDAQNPGATFAWSTGATTQTISVNSAGSYYVTVNNGCGIKKDTINITVNPLPGTAAAPSGQTLLCQNAANTNYTTTGASNATSYTWSVSPAAAGTFSGTGTTASLDWSSSYAGTATVTVAGVNGCGNGTSANLSVTVNPIAATPGAITGSQSVCAGTPYTYSVPSDPGALTYTWTLPSGWSGSSTSNSISTTATSVGGTISVIANNNCGSSSAATLTVTSGSVSQPGTISGNTNVCTGSSQIFSIAPVTGAASYSWTLPAGWSGTSTSNTITATAGSNNGTISVTASNACGSSSASNISVTAAALPTINTSAPTGVCAGSSTTLTASGANTYSWMPGSLSGSSVTVAPASSTTYTVTGTDANGCNGTQTVAITTNPLPVITTSGGSAVCAGNTASSLSASGGAVYTWMPGNINGANISVSPSATTTYTVTGIESVNGCSNTATATITVNAAPNIAATGGSTICASQTANLFASGGSTYSWSPAAGLSSTTGSVVAATPASTTTYTVTGIGPNGCSNTATVTVTVTPLPNVQITSPGSVCLGSGATIAASGATTYNWMPGSLTGASVNVTPASNTTYTVTGTTNGCSSSQAVTINVNQLPVVATNPNTTICEGNAAALNANGASIYTWMPGNLNGSSISVTPTANTTYTVTGTDGNGCSSTASVTVAIDNIAVSTAGTTICENNSASLTVSGASTYIWTPGNLTGSTVSVNPSATTTYTVVGTSSSGCTASSTATVTVDVVTAPVITASGTSLNIGSTPFSIQWYLNGNPINGATGTAYNALSNGSYTVCLTTSNSCQNCSSPSIVSSVGIIESKEEILLNILPNPNNGIFSLTGTVNDQNAQIAVINILGEEIQHFELNAVNGQFTHVLNLESQSNGVYFIKLKTSDGDIIKKMIKN
jgi:hypothetical protein